MIAPLGWWVGEGGGAHVHVLLIIVLSLFLTCASPPGRIHPAQALRQYREATGIDAKLIVVAMSASEFTIADPKDAGMLDMAGFDSAAPQVIKAFATGDI